MDSSQSLFGAPITYLTLNPELDVSTSTELVCGGGAGRHPAGLHGRRRFTTRV